MTFGMVEIILSNNGTTVTYNISILAVQYYQRMTVGVVEILLSNNDNTIMWQSRMKYNRHESDLFFFLLNLSLIIVTSYRLSGWCSICVEADNLLFAITSRSALLVTQPPTQWVPETPSLRVKRSEHKGGRLTSNLYRN